MKLIATAVLALAACTTAPIEPTDELVLDATPEGYAGTLRDLALVVHAGDRPTIQLTGDDGTSYADLAKIDGRLTGTLGDVSLDDLDPAHWATLADSDAGGVLDEIASAVAARAPAPDDALATVARLDHIVESNAFRTDAEELASACSSRTVWITVVGGTAMLGATTCNTSTRTGTVVNQCTNHSIYWRVRSYSSGGTINSGFQGHCAGGGVGTFYQRIWVEGLNAYGYFEGVSSY